MPEKASNINMKRDGLYYCIGQQEFGILITGYELLFLFSPSSMPSEEEAGEAVDMSNAHNKTVYYKGVPITNAIQYFSSLLLANEVYIENPEDKEPKREMESYCETLWGFGKDYNKWQQAEEKVWRGKIVVLKKMKT